MLKQYAQPQNSFSKLKHEVFRRQSNIRIPMTLDHPISNKPWIQQRIWQTWICSRHLEKKNHPNWWFLIVGKFKTSPGTNNSRAAANNQQLFPTETCAYSLICRKKPTQCRDSRPNFHALDPQSFQTQTIESIKPPLGREGWKVRNACSLCIFCSVLRLPFLNQIRESVWNPISTPLATIKTATTGSMYIKGCVGSGGAAKSLMRTKVSLVTNI